MKCTMGKCDREKKLLSLDKTKACTPEGCGNDELRRLLSYFQYNAPNIESAQSPLLDTRYHDEVLQQIQKSFGANGIFCQQNAKTDEELKKYALFGNELCSRCRRFLCKRMTNPPKRDRSRRETDLECFLRHVRNAIAHGYIFVAHGGNYVAVCFEDKNEHSNITARIVCCRADLKKWKRYLQEAMNKQKEEDA